MNLSRLHADPCLIIPGAGVCYVNMTVDAALNNTTVDTCADPTTCQCLPTSTRGVCTSAPGLCVNTTTDYNRCSKHLFHLLGRPHCTKSACTRCSSPGPIHMHMTCRWPSVPYSGFSRRLVMTATLVHPRWKTSGWNNSCCYCVCMHAHSGTPLLHRIAQHNAHVR